MVNLKNYLYKIFVLTGQDKLKVFTIILYFTIASLLDLFGIGLVAIYATFLVSPNLILQSDYFNNSYISLVQFDHDLIVIYIGFGL